MCVCLCLESCVCTRNEETETADVVGTDQAKSSQVTMWSRRENEEAPDQARDPESEYEETKAPDPGRVTGTGNSALFLFSF